MSDFPDGPGFGSSKDGRTGPVETGALEILLVQLLAAVVTLTTDAFQLEAHTSRRPEGVYVQGLLEEDGSLFLEVPSNQFLPIPLTDAEIDHLLGLGWHAPEDDFPNFWRELPADGITPGLVAALLVRTLTEVYGVADGDEFTLRPADLALDALPPIGITVVESHLEGGEPATEEPDPESKGVLSEPREDASAVLCALLELAGAREFTGLTASPWRLLRIDQADTSVAVPPDRDRARMLVEVPGLAPEDEGRAWHLDTGPYTTQSGPALDRQGAALWLATAVDPWTISLAEIPGLVAGLARAAAEMPQRVQEISAAAREERLLWEALDSVDTGAARLMRRLRRGRWDQYPAARDRRLARWRTREWVVGGYWHVADELSSTALGVRWLTGRPAPDCGHLFVGPSNLVVTGAYGWVALSVEDTPAEPGAVNLLGVLGDELGLASKADSVAERVMPHGEFGWLRPLLLEGSTRTATGRVLRFDLTSQEMVEDPDLTAAWLVVLRTPHHSEAVGRLKVLVGDYVNEVIKASYASDLPDSGPAIGFEGALSPRRRATMDVAMVRRPVPSGCHVVEGSTPVVAFGDPSVAKVATLGINPSKAEFLEKGIMLSGARRRLATLESLGAPSTDALTRDQIAQVELECAQYFHRNPFRTWFDRLDRILARGLAVSYYDDTACHLDIVQWATDPIWGSIPDPQARQRLLDEGAPHLRRQLESENVRLVIVNGDSAWRQLVATGIANYEDVDQFTYGNTGQRATLRVGHGCGVPFLGWSLNVQSSRGVRREDHDRLADWLRRMTQPPALTDPPDA